MKFGLVEDQLMVRSFLRDVLVTNCEGTAVFEEATLEGLRRQIPVIPTLDVLLLDIRLPDGDGIDVLPELLDKRISTPVILVSSSCEDFIVHRVSRAFVQGFVHKDDEPAVLVTAVQTVLRGASFFSPRFEERRRSLLGESNSFEKILSTREQEVLRLIGAGYSDAEVAPQLGLSARTVKVHRYNIMTKLSLHSARELQAYALTHGFTTVAALR